MKIMVRRKNIVKVLLYYTQHIWQRTIILFFWAETLRLLRYIECGRVFVCGTEWVCTDNGKWNIIWYSFPPRSQIIYPWRDNLMQMYNIYFNENVGKMMRNSSFFLSSIKRIIFQDEFLLYVIKYLHYTRTRMVWWSWHRNNFISYSTPMLSTSSHMAYNRLYTIEK